jgi:hypothetical protein
MKTNKMYIPAIFEPTYCYYEEDSYDNCIDTCENNIKEAINNIAKQVSKLGIDVDKLKTTIYVDSGNAQLLVGKGRANVRLDIEEYKPISKKELIKAIKASPCYKPNVKLQNLRTRRSELSKELEKINKALERFGIYE